MFMKCEYSENNIEWKEAAHSIWYGKYTLFAFKTFNYVFSDVRNGFDPIRFDPRLDFAPFCSLVCGCVCVSWLHA